jgi:hypothetical protein
MVAAKEGMPERRTDYRLVSRVGGQAWDRRARRGRYPADSMGLLGLDYRLIAAGTALAPSRFLRMGDL